MAEEGGRANDNARSRLSSQPLHEQFYQDVSTWFKRIHGPTFDDLRHLIRILFVFLMQSRGVFPDVALWSNSERAAREDGLDVHERIQWLFTEVLAIETKRRSVDNLDAERRILIETIPFLNGSLFPDSPDSHQPQQLSNAMYLATGTEPGLLTILRRYDWTLSEPTSAVTESALDPRLLGTLFERLMLTVKGPRMEAGGKVKMPDGSYYTPQDIADEMAADAIGQWLAGQIADLDGTEARMLAHPSTAHETWLEWSEDMSHTVLERLQSLRILDPCCGSGAFTVAMLQAVHRGESRLLPRGGGDMERIIERQLYAVDLHPIAVLITRLRLFLALTEWRQRKGQEFKPLPSLEARCAAADSLRVRCDIQDETLLLGGDGCRQALGNWQAAREMWTIASSRDEKKIAHEDESIARQELRVWFRIVHGEVPAWLEYDCLDPKTEEPAPIDLRHLLAAPEGWDIVIGNPPYQQVEPADRKKASGLGYITGTGYGNLYTLFLEMAIEVAKSDGCIVLIVPHSIVFGQKAPHVKLREKIQHASMAIYIRTYDNRPMPMFPAIPWLRREGGTDENPQRVTVVTIRRGAASPRITSAGLVRLSSSNRSAVLRTSILGQLQPSYSKQWTQAPTEATAGLLKAMRTESKGMLLGARDESMTVTLPPSARYFLSCLPEGVVRNRRRKRFRLPTGPLGWAWIGLYNSHLFHAYWLMVGDAFDVTAKDWNSISAPPGWDDLSVRDETARLARNLLDPAVVSACWTEHHGHGGKVFPNVNFHQSPAAEIIKALDHQLIAAYGLSKDPLLEEIRTMRVGSAHDLFVGRGNWEPYGSEREIRQATGAVQGFLFGETKVD